MIDVSHHIHVEEEGDPCSSYPVMEIFGRVRDGRSITVLYPRYYPCKTFPQQAVAGNLEFRDVAIVKTEEDLWLRMGLSTLRAVKVFFRTPDDLRRLREQGGMGEDLPFRMQFLADFNLGYCIRVVGTILSERCWGARRYTTDVLAVMETAQEIPCFSSPLRILSFVAADRGHHLIWALIQNGDVFSRSAIEGHAPAAIGDFASLVAREDPDVLNDAFACCSQLAGLMQRSARAGTPLRLGRDLSEPQIVRCTFEDGIPAPRPWPGSNVTGRAVAHEATIPPDWTRRFRLARDGGHEEAFYDPAGGPRRRRRHIDV